MSQPASTPLLRIDLASRVPAYEQIVAELRALLVSGELSPGDPLPTVRQLAIDLGVHHNTVAQSYRILAGEGWLELRRGAGARVKSRRSPAAAEPKINERFALHLRRLVAKAVAEGITAPAIVRELHLHAAKVENWPLVKERS